MTFKPGDRAIIDPKMPVYRDRERILLGRTCTLVDYCGTFYKSICILPEAWRVDVEGINEGTIWVSELFLIPITDPPEASSWEEVQKIAGWAPKGVTA